MTASSPPKAPPGPGVGPAGAGDFLGGVFFRRPQLAYALLAGTTGLFLLLFFGYPLLNIFTFAFFDKALTLAHFRDIFS